MPLKVVLVFFVGCEDICSLVSDAKEVNVLRRLFMLWTCYTDHLMNVFSMNFLLGQEHQSLGFESVEIRFGWSILTSCCVSLAISLLFLGKFSEKENRNGVEVLEIAYDKNGNRNLKSTFFIPLSVNRDYVLAGILIIHLVSGGEGWSNTI